MKLLKHAMKLDVKKTVEGFTKKTNWEINENSNQRFSYPLVSWKLASEMMRQYTLSQVYPKRISDAHINGDLHIHNLYMGITGYCCGWSLPDLLMKGIKVPHQVVSSPPKHFTSALNQIVNFFGLVSNEWSGAQALNSLDVFMAPFIR